MMKRVVSNVRSKRIAVGVSAIPSPERKTLRSLRKKPQCGSRTARLHCVNMQERIVPCGSINLGGTAEAIFRPNGGQR